MDPSAINATPAPGATPATGAQGAAATGGAATTSAELGSGFAALLAALGLGVDSTVAVAAKVAEGEGAVADGEGLAEASTPDAAALAAALAAAATVSPTVKDPTKGAATVAECSANAAGDGAPKAAPAPSGEQKAAVTGAASLEAAIAPAAATPAVSETPPTTVPPAVSASTVADTVARTATSDDSLSGGRVSTVGKPGAAAATKDGLTDDATKLAAADTAGRSAPASKSSGKDPEFGSGQQSSSDGRHVELTQGIANRDGGAGAGRGLESVTGTSPAAAVQDIPHAPPLAPTPLHDVEEFVRLSSLRGATPLRDGGEMRLQLSPEGLGNVEVRVTVRQDGVHASLVTDQDQTRNVLQANRASLESALGRSSLRLEGFTVDLGFQQQPQGDGRQQQQQPTPAQVFSNWFGPETTAATPDVAAVANPTAVPRGALSVHA